MPEGLPVHLLVGFGFRWFRRLQVHTDGGTRFNGGIFLDKPEDWFGGFYLAVFQGGGDTSFVCLLDEAPGIVPHIPLGRFPPLEDNAELTGALLLDAGSDRFDGDGILQPVDVDHIPFEEDGVLFFVTTVPDRLLHVDCDGAPAFVGTEEGTSDGICRWKQATGLFDHLAKWCLVCLQLVDSGVAYLAGQLHIAPHGEGRGLPDHDVVEGLQVEVLRGEEVVGTVDLEGDQGHFYLVGGGNDGSEYLDLVEGGAYHESSGGSEHICDAQRTVVGKGHRCFYCTTQLYISIVEILCTVIDI